MQDSSACSAASLTCRSSEFMLNSMFAHRSKILPKSISDRTCDTDDLQTNLYRPAKAFTHTQSRQNIRKLELPVYLVLLPLSSGSPLAWELVPVCPSHSAKAQKLLTEEKYGKAFVALPPLIGARLLSPLRRVRCAQMGRGSSP